MDSISALDIFSVVMDLFIGAVGTIIAVLQWKMEQRDRKEKKLEEEKLEKREAFFNFTKKYSSEDVLKSGNQINDNLFQILANNEALNRKKDPSEDEIVSTIDSNLFLMYQCFSPLNHEYTDIKKIYRYMLQNEREFSLSYGYGRYIDAFRRFVTDYKQKIIPIIQLWYETLEIIQKNESLDKDHLNTVQTNYKTLFRSMDTVNDVNKNIMPYLEELALGALSDKESDSEDQAILRSAEKADALFTGEKKTEEEK